MRSRTRAVPRVHLPDPEPSDRIYWGDDEIDRVARETLRLRRIEPDTSLVSHINDAQARVISQDRRRTIKTAKAAKLVVNRMKEVEAEVWAEAQKVEGLEEQIRTLRQKLAEQPKPATKDDILAALTPEEVVARFSEVVLNHLAVGDIQGWFKPEELLGGLPLAKVAGYAVENVVALHEGNTNDIIDHLTSAQQ